MAVRRAAPSRWRRLREAVSVDRLQQCLFSPELCAPMAALLLLAECVINVAVIERVKYTEIDWRAYMQEVEGVYNGTLDYSRLGGDTGPLVYPAGFVYIFLGLYHITSGGANMRLAQYIFMAIYLANWALVSRLYVRSKKVPPYVLAVMSLTSYRVHSIYVLRLFNDPVAMLLLYASINCFMDARWSLGSLLFSLGVSVKMSVLLFAPALLLAYLYTLGFWGTVKQLTICGGVQVALGAPFLAAAPVAYLRGAFDLGRVFQYQWTVNWRCLAEEVFLDRRLHVLLLALHLIVLAVFAQGRWRRFLSAFGRLQATGGPEISCQLLLLPLFTANLIGMAFARSLHYQFYVWYYHSLPYLLWSAPFAPVTRLCLLGVIELCWNTYPSTPLSSAALHCCHLVLIAGLWRTGGLLSQVAPPARAQKLKK
ncbi:lethal(2)neighbour of Tid protein-like [Amphibalanus amphitrite]|uniref:lethal(2)neighbour of Tid protein-like n=1 Tax=Amphibalanus amphitrite TaxID=1232801 RepID=UPI001C91F4B8|nr:lethal(2)neighbour of Tid protein-like [Amphibalanus amphitrite]XP_043210040.1 lethal(2)neighbour of Tid protein-like [Amphibalanus amphitrite]XP_043210041.1 lethal(2)neighbour of Tid protein-like [Amphibalanus amphitrite]